MSVASGAVVRYADAGASAYVARQLRSNGSLVGTVTTSAADELVLRLRGDQFSGAPWAIVHVDGVRVASLGVSATRWTDYVVKGAWAASRHRVQVSFTNDLYVRGVGDRNLRVDRFVFRASPATSRPAPGPAAPVPAARTAAAPLHDDAYDRRVVTLVNAARAKAGRAPLAVSRCADRYAEQWSAHLTRGGQFAHRSDLGAVMRSCAGRSVGENIAYGNLTADQMMALWMRSPGHRANILNARFTHIGVGTSTTGAGRTYGTQNFLTL